MHLRFTTPLLFGLLATACSTTSRQEGAPVQVDAMVTWIEKVHVETERSRMALADSYERLQTLVGGDFTAQSAVTAYARFVQAIDVAEQQAKRLAETIAPMQESAQPVFTQWQQDVATIQNERLRRLSEARMALARERYQAIATAATTAKDGFDGYVRSLRDQATFLAHDLNATALQELRTEVAQVKQSARVLDDAFAACLGAARAYVEQSALPAAPPAGPTR
jgi:hypothetical protein